MKLFIIASLIAMSAAGRLDRVYLPPVISGPLIRPGGPSPGAPRPRPGGESAAQIVKLDSDVTATGFQYSFETQNGISAQASGEDQGDGLQSQGAFSYPGTDGQTYTVTYTADGNGFQPQGAHLPTAPPIPEEILKSLEQNARDEAAGIVDDGSYDAAKYGEDVGLTGSRQIFQTIQTNQIQSGIRRPQTFSPQSGYRY